MIMSAPWGLPKLCGVAKASSLLPRMSCRVCQENIILRKELAKGAGARLGTRDRAGGTSLCGQRRASWCSREERLPPPDFSVTGAAEAGKFGEQVVRSAEPASSSHVTPGLNGEPEAVPVCRSADQNSIPRALAKPGAAGVIICTHKKQKDIKQQQS
ncbi:hypothetical protein NDU88_003764 [Pleurodeles waltl]|uniref:Uncharacterized protein n=1 Tax=Pleurodeles waltl TaxID=8319 RepID=A0AAV7V0Y3_PLEWA|nr:hypothetical protein NDU88_003764 [Pleurodeles waltl]